MKTKRAMKQIYDILLEEGPKCIRDIIYLHSRRYRNTPTICALGNILSKNPHLFRKHGRIRRNRSTKAGWYWVSIWDVRRDRID